GRLRPSCQWPANLCPTTSFWAVQPGSASTVICLPFPGFCILSAHALICCQLLASAGVMRQGKEQATAQVCELSHSTASSVQRDHLRHSLFQLEPPCPRSLQKAHVSIAPKKSLSPRIRQRTAPSLR
ncbi:hypothetical protein L209DRAFT_438592, partial [Thermothelomyces heterothallicus CBS 203.75]